MLSVSKIKSRTLFYVKDNVAGNEKKKTPIPRSTYIEHNSKGNSSHY